MLSPVDAAAPSLARAFELCRCSCGWFWGSGRMLSWNELPISTSTWHHRFLDAALKFGRSNKSVVGMTSSEGESFAFRSPVAVDGPVEVSRLGARLFFRLVMLGGLLRCWGSRALTLTTHPKTCVPFGTGNFVMGACILVRNCTLC